MFRTVLRLFCVAAVAAAVSGCGSSGGVAEVETIAAYSPPVRVRGDVEAYDGPLAAAVAPVEFPGGSEADRNWLQAEIARGLEESGAFATVIRLQARGQNNEADVVIDPTVVSTERYSGGLSRVDLRLRSQTKTTGRIGVDQVYRGKRSGNQSAIRDAVATAGRDLRRKYGG
jgi:hypothetical protein